MKNSSFMACDTVTGCYKIIYCLHLQRFKVHDDKGNTFLQNNGNNLTSNAVLHPWRLESLIIPMWKPQNTQSKNELRKFGDDEFCLETFNDAIWTAEFI